MNRNRAAFVLLPMTALWAGYLYCFWRGRLAYFGVSHGFPAAVLTAFSLGMMLYRLIPIKIRTIFVLYLGIFGLLADVGNLFLEGPLWEMLYGSGTAVALAMGAVFLWGWLHGKQVLCRRYALELEKGIPRPLKIGLLSDVHMGLCVDRAKLDRVCQALEEEALDLLLLAGDLCDDQTSQEDMHYAIDRMGRVSTALGIYAVFGNHDLGIHGPPLHYTAEEFCHALSLAGIQVLEDTAVDTPDFLLLGRRDIWLAESRGGRMPAAALLSGDLSNRPVLVLDHQPRDAREAARAGADLQLSGHTHAGQVWPASWLGRLSPTFYGLHRFGKMTLAVSSGLGGRGSRLRSGCSAEYVILQLHGRGANVP